MASRSVFALWTAAILIAALVSTPLAMPAAVDAQAASSVVLWNRLGSQAEVENSEVGLDGTFHGGGGFTGGVFGAAFQADYTQNNQVTFPKEAIPIYEGTIEFWARLHGFPGGIVWGHAPAFIRIHSPDPPAGWFVHLNSNDGGGNGGLCGGVGFNLLAGTGEFRAPGGWTYEEILGVGQAETWHHYALVWDADGLPGVGDGTHNVAVYLDGQLNSAHWSDFAVAEFRELTGSELGLIFFHRCDQGVVTIDNLIIWSEAKTDFAHRFRESPFAPCSLTSFHTGNGRDTVELTYTLPADSDAFAIDFTRSADTVFDAGDQWLSSYTVSDPALLAAGTHTLLLRLGTDIDLVDDDSEADADYYLLAVADPTSAGGTRAFEGVYRYPGAEHAVFVHGTAANDDVVVKAGGVSLNGAMALQSGVPAYRIRSHGGADLLHLDNAPATADVFAHAGDGDDALRPSPTLSTLDGGPGSDTVTFVALPAGVAASLTTGLATWGSGTCTLLGLENMIGTNLPDQLAGDDGPNRLEGLGGDDLLWPGLGDDVVEGNAGLDTVDYAHPTATRGVTVRLANQMATGHGLDRLYRIEAVLGTAYDDSLTGDRANNRLSGRGGADTLRGGGGDDVLYATDDTCADDFVVDWLYGERGLDEGYGNLAQDQFAPDVESTFACP